MAKRNGLKREMTKAESCNFDRIIINGTIYNRIQSDGETRCHDCGVLGGGAHHFGCDNECCPDCGMQLVGCDCNVEAIVNEGGKIIKFTDEPSENILN